LTDSVLPAGAWGDLGFSETNGDLGFSDPLVAASAVPSPDVAIFVVSHVFGLEGVLVQGQQEEED
jgi:hypothetical protein